MLTRCITNKSLCTQLILEKETFGTVRTNDGYPHNARLINFTRLAKLTSSEQPMCYFGRCVRLASHISVATFPAKPVVPIYHFVVDDFRYSAFFHRHTPAQPHVEQLYYSKMTNVSQLLCTIQIVSHSAVNLVSPQFSIEIFLSAVRSRDSGYPQRATINIRLDRPGLPKCKPMVSPLCTLHLTIEHSSLQIRS